MRYKLIKGNFFIIGLQPDGDTIRFQPDNPQFIDNLGPIGQTPDWKNNRTRINVRFEGIDALETHFQGTRQNTQLGDAATRRMLALVGFQDLQVAASGGSVTGATPHPVRGYLAAKELDSFGRVIAFVFAGEINGKDGKELFVDIPTLSHSVNAKLLDEGLVYPAFYGSLPVDLKNQLSVEARSARANQIGLWPQATATLESPATIPDLATVEGLVIWPKLFRRLSSYFGGGNQGLAGFDAWLREDNKNRDDYIQLPTGELGNMHDVVQVIGQTLLMKYRPEDLVVMSDHFVPPQKTNADLRIVAALVNPTGSDAGHETVTVINTGSQALDLTGWEIRDRQNGKQSLTGMLAAGECSRVILGSSVQLANSGDDILLVNPQNQEVQRVAYNAADGGRQSVTLVF